MLTLYQDTVPQDRALTWHSAAVRDYREMARLDVLPFGPMWWGYAPQMPEVN